MLSNFITDSEFKHAEYMIIKNKICTSMIDINNVLEKDAKNSDNKIIDKNKQKDYYKEIINKKEENKKEDNKKKDNKNNKNNYSKYNLLYLIFLLKKLKKRNIIRIINKKREYILL